MITNHLLKAETVNLISSPQRVAVFEQLTSSVSLSCPLDVVLAFLSPPNKAGG